MFILREVIRALVGGSCLLVIGHHAYAQPSEREMPFVAEAHYTDTFALAEDGQLRSVTWEVARDRAGRMRVDRGREIFIADPTKARYFYLDTQAKTVRGHAMPAKSAAASAPPGLPLFASSATARAANGSSVPLLGPRVIEGYLCEGRLITRFINVDRSRPESAVKVETEAWIAKEIGPVLVITKTSEGRQTRYALKNIRTEEAPPERFAVPSGFEVLTEASTISH